MPTYRKPVRFQNANFKRIVKLRAKLEAKTGEIVSLEKAVMTAVESLLKET